MKEIQFVNAQDLQTIEEYAACLLSGMISLKTLEAYHINAFKKGILDEDEQENMKTICWELQRLLNLYQTQINHVLDRTNLSEKDILENLKKIMPKINVPRKRKVKEEK